MRRTLSLIMAGLIVVSACYLVFGDMHEKMGEKAKADKCCMDKMGSCPRCSMMAKCMTSKHMAVTEDGEVIILVGHTLMKYDEDMELVKQVELKIDMEKIEAKMKAMMESCPMSSKGCCMDKKM